MTVHWTDYAVENLSRIHDHVLRESGSEVRADRQIKRLVKRGRNLASFQLLGQIVPEWNDPSVRQIIEGSYRVIYRVNTQDDRVDVLTVHHGKLRLPRLDELLEEALRRLLLNNDPDATRR